MVSCPISHITLGINDTARAAAFCDAVLGVLGFTRLPKPAGKPPAYAKGDDFPYICLYCPIDGREQVHAFHQAALETGGSDEGPPGLRPHYGPNHYAAYVRDPDGNKLEAVCYDAEDRAA